MGNGSSDRIRILAVDDEKMVLEVYKEFLSSDIQDDSTSRIGKLSRKLFGSNAAPEHKTGYAVTACRQGAEAVRAVELSIKENDPFALAFIDIRMPPGQDGIVTARQIRQIDPGIEIVIVTGFSDYDPETISQQVPPAHKLLYIQKPIYPHEINQFAASLSAKWVMERNILKTQQEMENQIKARTRQLETANQQLRIDMEKRVLAEQALRDSEEKFRNIVKNISDYICVHDMEGRILETNVNFKEKLGYSDVDGDNRIQALIPNEHQEKFKEYLTRIKENKTDEGTMILKTVKGKKLIVEYKNKLVKSSSGDLRVIGSARDVTDQLNTQKALQQSEMLFRMLFEKAGDAIFLINAEPEQFGRIMAANQAAAEMHGYSLDELLTLTIMDLDSNEDSAKVHDRAERMINGEWIRDQIYHKRKDGTLFPVEISAGFLKLEGKKYFLAFDRDISKQKIAREKLRQSEEKYRLLVDNAQDAVFILQQGCIKFANPRTLSILEYDRQTIGTQSFMEFVRPRDRDKVAGYIDTCLQDESVMEPFSFGVVSKNNDHLWFQMTGVRVVWEDTPSLLCFAKDITNTRDLENQLIQVQKMEALGTLAGGIAHDFNNILSVILGNIQLLGMYIGKDGKENENLNRVMHASYRAKELVSQILTFSRKGDDQKHPVSIELIVKEALKLLRASTPSNIEFKNKFEKNTGAVLANPTQIQQVLLNLCTNAVHAMTADGGILQVSLESVEVRDKNVGQAPAQGTYVLLKISDTGSGMDEKIINRIFDPYFTTKKPGEGTGLGLSIVHGIAEKLKGHIDIQSVPGQGTVFSVYFPRAHGSDNIKKEDHSVLKGGNEHILLIDDETMLLETMGDLIEDMGYRVTLASDSADAYKAFLAQPDQFDVIITDLTMPQMSGTELASKIYQVRPDIPIALHTGLAAEVPEDSLHNTGIKTIIRKPVLEKDLAKTIRNLLEK